MWEDLNKQAESSVEYPTQKSKLITSCFFPDRAVGGAEQGDGGGGGHGPYMGLRGGGGQNDGQEQEQLEQGQQEQETNQ